MSLFIAAMPKSGSTHLQATLANACGLLVLDSAHIQNEAVEDQNICPHCSHFLQHPTAIFKQHLLPTTNDIAALEEAKIPTVVLTRNLPDAILSLEDHLAEDVSTSHFAFPTLYGANKSYQEMRRADKIAFLVDNWVPWVMQFVVGWKGWERAGFPLLWIDYDEHFGNQVDSFEKICHYAALDPMKIEEELATKKKWRFNKGERGRGWNDPLVPHGKLLRMTRNWGPDWAPVLREVLLGYKDY